LVTLPGGAPALALSDPQGARVTPKAAAPPVAKKARARPARRVAASAEIIDVTDAALAAGAKDAGEPAEETPEEVARRTRRGHGPGKHAAGPRVRPLAKADGEAADPRELPTYDWDEIVKHDRVDDYWIAFAGGVFDVSEWLYHHPGGPEVFIQAYGQNATKAFGKAGHSADAWNVAQSFRIGNLKKGSKPTRVGPPQITRGSCPVAHDGSAGTAGPMVPPPRASAEGADDGAVEIPWAVRWLTPRGERFANWDILNDNDTQLEYAQKFGPIYACGVPTKKWRIVTVSDPDLLDEVAGNEEQFDKRIDEINFFAQLASSRGGGISVVADSDYYDRVRRIMLPWYAPAHQKTQFEMMKAQAKSMVTAWEALDDAAPLDMRRQMELYALQISGRGACNYDFGLLGPGAEPTPFGQAVTDSTKESVRRIVEPRPDLALPGTKKGRAKKKYDSQNALLFETMDNVVKGRLNICPVGEQTDLLSRLVTVPDPETKVHLAPEEIRDQLLMHLSNGFNGPSITAAWIAHVVASYADVEENLLAEIDAVTGGDPDYELQYTDLMAMPYMTQVIKETLRIYPPMPITIRRSKKDGMLGKYRIRKDDIIFVGALAAHRDPRYWGPDADVFDPDQFAMEKVVERPRHAFIPFSVGPRQCMAQEVTFMMLRVGLFEIFNRYRLRSAGPVKKNTAATTKPVAVPVVRVPREGKDERQAALAARKAAAKASAAVSAGTDAVGGRAWDRPSEIPATSAFQHLVVAYGSNFGSSKELAERFAERSRVFGYTSEVVPLNDLVTMPAKTQPWLLTVMTATYTANAPSNALAFKAWLEATDPGAETWKNCRYHVWGLGNSQWNAFLAFPRYVDTKLAELGASRIDGLGFGDVGSPIWEDAHTAWNDRTWPQLIEMSGAAPSEAAAARFAAEKAAEEALTAADSDTAMALSLDGEIVAPTLLTNAVGIATHSVRALVCRELQAPESPTKTRHLEVSLPPDFEYTAGDHLGVCPQNDEETLEKLSVKLGAALDGVFSVPKSMKVRAVPKGTPLQVRNVLTCLVDLTSMPSVQLLDLLLDKVEEPDQRAKLQEIKDVLMTPDGPDSPLRAAVRAGGYDILQLLEEFDSCAINIFEFLQVAQPLRPRYYSTSSSPRIHGNGTAHVSIGRNVSPVPGMPDRQFRGMSSHYVHTLREGDRMNIFLDRAEGFHMQDDVTKPMLFVSAGTGYAPMRAFLWERLALKREGVKLGTAALFNGIRASKLDYIYADEIQMFVDEGVLDHLHVAMSREKPGVRDYVQDRITSQAALNWKLIDKGAFVYVCGSQQMRDDVRTAFVTCIAKGGKKTPAQAEAYMAAMEGPEDRYRPDVWG
jgi:cytochrome P450/NADPH-cytochrome P450 reductase